MAAQTLWRLPSEIPDPYPSNPIPGLRLSLANSKNDTQMATITLPTAEAFQRCLQDDGKCTLIFDDKFDDLTILHAPEDAEVDICAVHGLNGHAFETWKGKDLMWLRDLLPTEAGLKKARIMTVGYNAKLSDKVTMARLPDLADKVLHSVRMAKKSAKAMLRLRARPPEKYDGITLNECGFLFLATPFSGAKDADWNHIVMEATKASLGTRIDLLQELEVFNPFTVLRQGDFAAIDPRPPFYCFCEGGRMAVYGTLREIVPAGSAGLLGETAQRLDGTDHHTVCRFDTRDNNFGLVCKKLQALCLEIQDRQEVNRSLINKTLKSLFLQALKEHRLRSTLAVRRTLGEAYNSCFSEAKLCHWREAEASYGLLVIFQKRMLGEEHPDTLLSIAKYAWTLRSQEKLEPAEKACRQARNGMRKSATMGPRHIDTLVTSSDLGSILTRRHQPSEAVDVLWGVPEAIETILGRKAFDAIMALEGLGGCRWAPKDMNLQRTIYAYVQTSGQNTTADKHRLRWILLQN